MILSMYHLDFETVKQVMQAHQKTGFLYTEVSAKAAGTPEPCRIEIHFQAGTIISCFIISSSGHRIKDEESAKRLARLGKLNWTFVPQEETVIQQASPAPAPAPVQVPALPQRTVHLEQWQMNSWPRIHRRVFALADGTRNIGKIAEVLSTSPEVVRKVLQDLQSIGVVNMGRGDGI